MIAKRFSREDYVNCKIPISAKFIRKESDSDYLWYYVFTNDEYNRLIEYYRISEKE